MATSTETANIPYWVEAAKAVMPWITGGLAGAILTGWLTGRRERSKLPQLDVRVASVSYSPQKAQGFENAKVHISGQVFDELEAHEIEVTNVSSRTTKGVWCFAAPKDATVVSESWIVTPVQRDPNRTPAGKVKDGAIATQYDFGDLLPGDIVRGRILVSKTGPIQWIWRGSSETAIRQEGRIEIKDFEADMRAAVLWLATFFLSDSLYIFGAPIKSALFIFAMPWFLRNAERLRATIKPRNRHEIRLVNTDVAGDVVIRAE